MRSRRGSLDLILVFSVMLLVGGGAFMVYSSSVVIADAVFSDQTYFLTRQLSWICIGLAAMWVLAHVDYHRWQHFSLLMLLACVLLLVAVLVPGIGKSSYGSTRWLIAGPIQIQPSELVKLALVIYMADWLAGKGRRVGEFMHSSLPFLIILGIVCALVVVEPDFGTTVIIALTAISIFFVAGANLVQFVGALALMGGVFWLVMIQAGYRSQRILAWLNPWDDPQGHGWHTIQTLIALGSGGVSGLGLGASRQKHSWLVNAHTDAILAIVGEELGLIGTLAVLILFGVVLWRGATIAYRSSDAFGRLLAAGVTTKIFWQAAINFAVVTNSSPYTGVTLPFVSFGGNSTVVSLAAIGLLLSVARYRNAPTMVREDQSLASGRRPPHDERRRRRARTSSATAVVSASSTFAPPDAWPSEQRTTRWEPRRAG